MSADEIVWECPPPIANREAAARWPDRLAPLMEHPGQWANLGEYASATTNHLSAGRLSTPPGRWEFTGRRGDRPKGRSILYARYLGPAE